MPAGAVPLVFDGGGVREIVTSGTDGVLWTSLDDLADATRRLAKDGDEVSRLRRAAMRRAATFGLQQHDQRIEAEQIAPVRQRP